MIYVVASNTESLYGIQSRNHIHMLNFLQIRHTSFCIEAAILESVDYLLFTSKNAIKAILQHDLFTIFLQKQAIVIGDSTKQAWIKAGGKIAFCPDTSCNGYDLATILKNFFTDSTQIPHLLYLCGQDRITNFKVLLKNTCKVTEIIVYRSLMIPQTYDDSTMSCIMSKESQKFVKDSIFIFGSPKQYKAFIQHYTWQTTWLAIALGDTTFACFAEDICKINAKGNLKKALQIACDIENSCMST